MNDLFRAEQCYREVLQIQRTEGNLTAVAHTLVNLGNLHIASDHPERARPYYLEALAGRSTRHFAIGSGGQAGGFMRTQVPRFRLPESVIDEEVGYILRDNVQFVGGRRIDSMKTLLAEGFDESTAEFDFRRSPSRLLARGSLEPPGARRGVTDVRCEGARLHAAPSPELLPRPTDEPDPGRRVERVHQVMSEIKRTNQALLPIVDLSFQVCTRQPLSLPDGEIRVLNGKFGQYRRSSGTTGFCMIATFGSMTSGASATMSPASS